MLAIFNSKIFWITSTILLSVFTSNPAIGLILGIIIGLIFTNPLSLYTGKLSKKLLQLSVILLGFGLKFSTIINVGIESVSITLQSIVIILIVGFLLCKAFSIEKNTSILITGGTAICGGSAIAALAPSINASYSQIAVSTAIIFLLNAIGLLIFPPIGQWTNMSQEHFGLWAAIAIHDTSSVVGASAAYGTVALLIGTTVKLIRALWIIPLSFITAKFYKSESKVSFPLFLIGFIIAGLIRSVFPEAENLWNNLALSGKQMMGGTLFLIGSCISLSELKKIGFRPLVVAIILWIIISVVSFIAIKYNFWSVENIASILSK